MSFDALAPHYRWMEPVLAGNKLQRCRTAFLSQVAESQSVLIAGEGNGRFLTECRRGLPAARIKVVDASARMLEAARGRMRCGGMALDGIEFVHTDIRTWKPDAEAHDLIVTHYFLDCFPEEQLAQVVAKLARAAKPSAAWLLADFQVPACGLQRYRARIIHALMYTFFRATARLPARRLVPPDDFLKAQNFVLEERRSSDWGLLHSDWWTRQRVSSSHEGSPASARERPAVTEKAPGKGRPRFLNNNRRGRV